MYSFPPFNPLKLNNKLRGHFIEYLLDREDVKPPWKEHTEHEFVKQMANGTLPIEKFKTYLIQDYLFLVRRTSYPHIPQANFKFRFSFPAPTL